MQRDLLKNPVNIGKWEFYNIGATSIRALKEYNIIRNVNYGAEERKKVDALLVQKKNVIAIVEYKKPSEFNTTAKQNKAIAQEIEVAKKLEAHIIIATDTKETVWINVLTGNRIKNEEGTELKINFEPKDEKLPDLIEKIIYSVSNENDQIIPKRLVNPTNLAKKIWQIVWSISGATPESCLYSFVELFIFKYLSDLGVLQEPENFEYVLKLYEKRSPEFVIDYYARNIRLKIKNELFHRGNDGTTIINGTVFVNNDDEAIEGRSTAFEKILKEFNNYGKLDNIHPDFKSQLFESFLKESISKKNWGQFFTPLKVVKAIVEMAKDEIRVGCTIGDPAGGVGKFLLEAIKPKINQFYRVENDILKSDIEIFGYDIGFDKDEQKTIILAKANMLIYFSDLLKKNKSITTQFADLFNKSFELKKNSILGTLAVKEEEKYDLILSNPPYVTSGSSNIKEEIKRKGLSDYYKINAIGVEGLFLEWIIKALKPNGKGFIVVPDGIFNRQNDKNLRQYLLSECFIDGIISLPIKTFFSTPKKTYILCVTKKGNREEVQTEPVFTYLVSEIGESRDVYRFDIERDDLIEAVKLFKGFCGSKEYFIENNTGKRCKIQPIEKFNPENHWSIDRWWTKEEQIELGVLAEDKSVRIEEFGEILSDISEVLKEYSSLLKDVAEKKKPISEVKEIFLSDKNYFDLFIGTRLLKKDLILVNGDIPVYSANVKTPISFLKVSNIDNFLNNFVIWGIDGDFEYNYIPKNSPFVTTDHCGTIRILKDDILPEYLMIQLEKVKHKYGFDRGLRSSLKNMQIVSIEIPFDDDGNIDIEKQKEIVEKYEYVFDLKSKIIDYKIQLEKLNVTIINNYKIRNVKIISLFHIIGEDNLTKSFINSNKGEYPVYSGQIENGGVFGYINTYKYDETILTWVTYGNSGHINKRLGKFNIGRNNCGLRPLSDLIDLDYIKFIAEPIFIENVKGEKQKSLPQTIVKDLEIPIPINSKGEFDLEAQKQIAEKYRKIEEIKKNISQELDRIANIEIDYE